MKTYTLTVDEADLQVIGSGLNELPRKFSEPVFAKLKTQVEKQDAEAAEAAKAAEESKTKNELRAVDDLPATGPLGPA